LPAGSPAGAIDMFNGAQATDFAEGAPDRPVPRLFTQPGVGGFVGAFDAATPAEALAHCQRAVGAYLPAAPRLPVIMDPAAQVVEPCAPCPAPAGTGCPAPGARVDAARITFDLYAVTLGADSGPALDAVAARLRDCASLQVEIQVHTDTVRTSAFNARQSQRVAELLRDRLVAAGIDASRLAPCGYGESRPVDPRATDWTPGSPNARVEWHVLAGPAASHGCPSAASP
jgi:outer membrane protein OmpA-like peptidoglycan-associated protein